MAKDIREEILEAAMAADEAAANQPQGECIRLLQCFECKTVEELPDYPPMANPNHDVTLHYLDERHGGHTEQPHYRTLHRVEKRVWEDRRAKRQIVKEMWSGVKGFTQGYYDIKDTLKDDAVKCFSQHNRQVPCMDYKDDSKRLKSPTRLDRRRLAADLSTERNRIDLGALAEGGPVQYLCTFCPVQVAVDYEKRQARGVM